MTLKEIINAVDAGKTVRWVNSAYRVVSGTYGDYYWFIAEVN